MAKLGDFPTLGERAKALLINFLFFYGVFVAASGGWAITGGLESVWLLSALSLWLLSLVSSPWFVPPRDALANGIAVLCILGTADLTAVVQFQSPLNFIRWAFSFYSLALIVASLVALFVHDRNPNSPGGRFVFRMTSVFGRAELFYTPPAIISILGAYQPNWPTISWLIIVWTFVIIGRPVERTMEFFRRWKSETVESKTSPAVGTVERIDDPNIVRVRLSKGTNWKTGALYVAALSDGNQQFILGLFDQVQGAEVMATGLCVAQVAEVECIKAVTGHIYSAPDQKRAASFVENLSGTKGAELVGFTVENSTIGTLRFEVAAVSNLSEGDVVFTKVAGRDVFYQILDAETAEESFDQNPRGTHIVKAAQLGCYDPAAGFTKHPWLPAMNSPLFWAKSREFPASILNKDEFIIGDVPSTNIGAVARVSDLVEFHTAILGVTGTGKTELALDIVREAEQRGVKVFCVDFTGEYRARLADLSPIFPAPSEQATNDLAAKLFDAETGDYGAGKEKRALEEALKTMRAGTQKQIEDFLTSEDTDLAILELAEIANSKATLRLTELYLSAIMNWARQHRKAHQILIVLEEAHTIIPEVAGAGFDFGTQWVVGRIGQIALQGRKYGVGLMVVTQRTALVSKTILSQCNTFLTHSLIDQTSLNFLQSVYSEQHTRSIPNLRFLEFLAFGKAIRTERPILLKRKFDQAKKDASEKLRQPLEPKPNDYSNEPQPQRSSQDPMETVMREMEAFTVVQSAEDVGEAFFQVSNDDDKRSPDDKA
jgi:hypothetical protein